MSTVSAVEPRVQSPLSIRFSLPDFYTLEVIFAGDLVVSANLRNPASSEIGTYSAGKDATIWEMTRKDGSFFSWGPIVSHEVLKFAAQQLKEFLPAGMQVLHIPRSA